MFWFKKKSAWVLTLALGIICVVPQFHPEIEVEELEPYQAFYRTQPDPKNGSSLRSPPLPGIRRIYFSDRLYSEEELPPEFKLFLPVGGGSADPATPRHAPFEGVVPLPSLRKLVLEDGGWFQIPAGKRLRNYGKIHHAING